MAPLSNLILQIDKIDYFSDGIKYSINPNNLTITSNHSYLLENTDTSSDILVSQMKEEILKLRHKNIKRTEKLELSMNIKKMQFTNSNLCEVYK